MISAFHHHYLVAWPDSRVVAGATRETGSGFAPHTTAAGVREVLGEALRVAPGLAAAEIREIRVGPAPVSPRTRCPCSAPCPECTASSWSPGTGRRADARPLQRQRSWPPRCSARRPRSDLTPVLDRQVRSGRELIPFAAGEAKVRGDAQKS